MLRAYVRSKVQIPLSSGNNCSSAQELSQPSFSQKGYPRKIGRNPKFLFVKISRNKRYDVTVLLDNFHPNVHTFVYREQLRQQNKQFRII